MVLLHLPGQKICDGETHEPRNRKWILEGDGEGPASESARGAGGNEEDLSFLPGKSSDGEEDQLGHARVQAGIERVFAGRLHGRIF